MCARGCRKTTASCGPLLRLRAQRWPAAPCLLLRIAPPGSAPLGSLYLLSDTESCCPPAAGLEVGTGSCAGAGSSHSGTVSRTNPGPVFPPEAAVPGSRQGTCSLQHLTHLGLHICPDICCLRRASAWDQADSQPIRLHRSPSSLRASCTAAKRPGTPAAPAPRAQQKPQGPQQSSSRRDPPSGARAAGRAAPWRSARACEQDAAEAASGEAGHTSVRPDVRTSVLPCLRSYTGLRVREAGRARELVCTCARGSLCAHSVCFSHGFISEDCFRA